MHALKAEGQRSHGTTLSQALQGSLCCCTQHSWQLRAADLTSTVMWAQTCMQAPRLCCQVAEGLWSLVVVLLAQLMHSTRLRHLT